jgi:hypothetical protein
MSAAHEAIKLTKVPAFFSAEFVATYCVDKPGDRPVDYDERVGEFCLQEIQGKLRPVRLVHVANLFARNIAVPTPITQVVWLTYFPTNTKTLSLISRTKARFAHGMDYAVMFGGRLKTPAGRDKGQYEEGILIHIWNLEYAEEAYAKIQKKLNAA